MDPQCTPILLNNVMQNSYMYHIKEVLKPIKKQARGKKGEIGVLEI